MTITDENVVGATNILQEKVVNHTERISRLNLRVSELTDEIVILKAEINNFKTAVAGDLKNIIAKIEE